MPDLPTRDYAKIADAMGGIMPLTDEAGRERCIITLSPAVLQYVCDGLRRLSRTLPRWSAQYASGGDYMRLDDLLPFCSWDELQFITALASEAESRGLQDLTGASDLMAYASPILEVAAHRQSIGQQPSHLDPAVAGFRTLREAHEHTIRSALWVGDFSRRFWPSFFELSDDDLAQFFSCIAAVVLTESLTPTQRVDAERLAARMFFGVHRITWPTIAAIVDANRVAENGGAAPDYAVLLDSILCRQAIAA